MYQSPSFSVRWIERRVGSFVMTIVNIFTVGGSPEIYYPFHCLTEKEKALRDAISAFYLLTVTCTSNLFSHFTQIFIVFFFIKHRIH